MRWLRVRRGDERGAMIILLAAFCVVMVGMAALVVDIGSLLDEKRQLQNGADAGALAIAQSCAIGPTCNSALAGPLANANSKDNESAAIASYPADKTVLVKTSTLTGGTSILPYSFGQILSGVSGKEVQAEASAKWAYAGRALALPLTISPCDKSQLQVGTQWTINLGIGFGACASRDAPGAFGWLDRPCLSPMIAGELIKVDTGASGLKCLTAATIGTIVILPVFLTTNGLSGKNTEYRILGFAALKLSGWNFPGDQSTPVPVGCSQPCIAGTFVNYVTTDQVGGGGNFGIFRVFLSQ